MKRAKHMCLYADVHTQSYIYVWRVIKSDLLDFVAVITSSGVSK